jgi:sirohydrochlorin cobaltochelatase
MPTRHRRAHIQAARRNGIRLAAVAFGGVAQPRLETVLMRSARLSFRRIIIFPYFLLAGVLVKQIYAHSDAAERFFPAIEFVKALYLRDHPEVLAAFRDRVRELCDSDAAGPR